ncbi:hypothetical protein ASPZODRAFT_69675 [Penicilliopsis zonata CBS 506.65]|uniref:Uncharacterized protein n=1 Tax=Penicilliopsis zonata CBS 506.65 TaxID=1073090 RepID=A0A1L9SED3_9EURO|nr:hypothetical protein ASPZODRAFT_69675 [Penicilliopsis zonata CBS 506.65]OJJ45539.1 hypothetical protein ASPZODRAFT_69675 [Penicilliopsis zonata CBS 506.65]
MPALTSEDLGQPLAKRQKRTEDEASQSSRLPGSKIFSPFRTLGLVSSTAVPFTSTRLGKSTFQLTTSVGRVLQTYDVRRGLHLVFLSRPQTPDVITATFAWQDKVFAAWGSQRGDAPGGVWVFKRGKKVAALAASLELNEPIDQLLVFGSWVVGCTKSRIEVWKSDSYEHYTTLRPVQAGEFADDYHYTGKMCNMPTYLNKIFIGRSDGGVDIWNVRTGKLLHSILPPPDAGAVTALEPAPVLSFLAIAHKSGALSIYNVEVDQPILSLRGAPSGNSPITSIAFRGDDRGAGHDGKEAGVMATTSLDSGDITLWDLNRGGRVTGVLRGAHLVSGGQSGSIINNIEFLDGQPILVSSGIDNSLRTWIFDETLFSPIPKPLHARRGHSALVTAITFPSAPSEGSEFGGKWLLSASKDCSLWGFSLRKDSQNAELSQGQIEHKAKKSDPSATTRLESKNVSEVTCIACSLNRDGGMAVTTTGPIWSNSKLTNTDASTTTGWESVITSHRGDKYARTWFWGKKKAGRWVFETGDSTEVKSVAISPCGTFAVIGSAGGYVDMFNLQSGAHRRQFPPRSPSGSRIPTTDKLRADSLKLGKARHTKAVTGLMIDGLNRTVISCGLDGKVKFWDFLSGNLLDELDWSSTTAITGLRFSSTSELVAFSCDDLSIRVVDIETRKLVRELWGCVGQVNDFTFSNDGRWIIAASMDSIIRVWDLPTGHLVDAFRVSSTCTALAMSATGEFLATAHADSIGVNIWNNRSLFMPVSTRSVENEDLSEIEAPTVSGEIGTGIIEAAFGEEQNEDDKDGPVLSPEQLARDLVTLSVVPRSRWQTLLNLDVIKERNKPKEAPKAPEKAPFFLPSLITSNTPVSGSDNQALKLDADPAHSVQTTGAERSQVQRLQNGKGQNAHTSRFTILLHAGHSSGNYEPFVEHLKSLPPAKADVEIRSLDPQIGAESNELLDFVVALTGHLKLRKDFELVNAWMSVFLRVHADIIRKCSIEKGLHSRAIADALADWSNEQQQEAKRLAQLMGYCRGVVGFLRSAR